MERDEFKILVKGMKAVYTQSTFIPDQDAFNVWYELLKDISYQDAQLAVRRYMLTEKFPPTIADIRTKLQDNLATSEDTMTELAAWNLVRRAIRNSIYNCVEEFERLPDNVRKAVGSPSQLRDWAMDENFNAEVSASNFMRSYRNVIQRRKELQKIPENIRVLINKNTDKLIGRN